VPTGCRGKKPIQNSRLLLIFKVIMASNIKNLTALITRDDNLYVALCPELDIASQGATVEEARANLKEAIELFLETADPSEVENRYQQDVYVSRIDVSVG